MVTSALCSVPRPFFCSSQPAPTGIDVDAVDDNTITPLMLAVDGTQPKS